MKLRKMLGTKKRNMCPVVGKIASVEKSQNTEHDAAWAMTTEPLPKPALFSQTAKTKKTKIHSGTVDS